MAIHIYMSQERILRDDRAPQADDAFNYRGEAGPGDDAQGFKRMMALKGFEVILAPKGELPAATVASGGLSTDHWRGIPRRNIEVA